MRSTLESEFLTVSLLASCANEKNETIKKIEVRAMVFMAFLKFY